MSGLKLDRKGKLVVPESSLEAAIFDLLTYDDWRVFRFGWAITEAGRQIGESASPDLLAIRYGAKTGWPEVAEVLWCELKVAHRKPTFEQRAWHIGEVRRGAVVLVAGKDFAPTVEAFKCWYAGSGLARRKS